MTLLKSTFSETFFSLWVIHNPRLFRLRSLPFSDRLEPKSYLIEGRHAPVAVQDALQVLHVVEVFHGFHVLQA